MLENPRWTNFQREESFLHDYQAVAVSGGNSGAESLLRLRQTSNWQCWGQTGVGVLKNLNFKSAIIYLT